MHGISQEAGFPPPDGFDAVLTTALARLGSRLLEIAPQLAGPLIQWTEELAGGHPPEAYFTHPLAFPTLLLPWWLEEALAAEWDPALQADLVYSSVAGYYAIRLVDDVMDTGDEEARHLLPAVFVLQSEFQSTYLRRFPYGHPFWDDFHRHWAGAAEAAAMDALVPDKDEEAFGRLGGRKVSAAAIPMIAVCRLRGLAELPPAWSVLFMELCRWHQFHNDLFDWQRDLESGAPTYFLSEARQRRFPDEPELAWVAREGFDWASAWLRSRMAAMRALARDAGSPSLEGYLASRERRMEQLFDEMRPGIRTLASLMSGRVPRAAPPGRAAGETHEPR